jgi:hypothetical protein
MTTESFLVVTDTPSIKQFVFGTDTLAEIRGASALLDRLNRRDTHARLQGALGRAGGRIETVYANGGSGQFLVEGSSEEEVRRAVVSLNGYYRQETGGEVKLAFGLSPLGPARGYREAVRTAHFQMRTQREMTAVCRSTAMLPFMKECRSASHLPASSPTPWGNEGVLLLSHASRRKREVSRRAREFGVWREWMQHLDHAGPWPDEDRWDRLRCVDFTEIGERAVRRGYIGLIYADGNAMGRLVQELDSPDVCHQFSLIVDSSIREACFSALDSACGREIAAVREAVEQDEPVRPLPADILLLGGDDLLALLPAHRALSFAVGVTEQFERLTQSKIAALTGRTKAFFRQRLGDQGLTISCGVAIGRANYPFYLLLDLAEALLKNAKRAGSRDKEKPEHCWAPAYVDFHVVAGASSHELKHLREDDYFTETAARRTLRPVSRDQLIKLCEGVGLLRQGQFPQSKLHDLLTAALNRSPVQAQRLVREVFSRCQKKEQQEALWQAVGKLCPNGHKLNFPWYENADEQTTAVADLVEAFDLFPRKENA